MIFSSCHGVSLSARHHLCTYIKSLSLPATLPPQALCLNWKQNKSVAACTVFGATILLGFWVIHHTQSPLATSGCEQSTGGSRISVTGVRRMAVCPGFSGGGGATASNRGVGDPWPQWEEAILTDSRTGIMNSIKRQAASKARQNKQQQGDSTRSLSGDEKLSCDFRVPVIISKGPFCIFADISAYEWAESSAWARKDCVMCQNVLVAYGKKDNTCRWRLFTLITDGSLKVWSRERERHEWVIGPASLGRLAALPPEEKTLASAPVIGPIVLLTQITIMMALLCQESGRQKAGNGWESRKGSGEACGGERWRKAVCVTRTGQGEGRGQTDNYCMFRPLHRRHYKSE